MRTAKIKNDKISQKIAIYGQFLGKGEKARSELTSFHGDMDFDKPCLEQGQIGVDKHLCRFFLENHATRVGRLSLKVILGLDE